MTAPTTCLCAQRAPCRDCPASTPTALTPGAAACPAGRRPEPAQCRSHPPSQWRERRSLDLSRR
eukprot:2334693-Pyramimonas_sp.AAC.1